MRYLAILFLATLFIRARSLNAFHYKTSMRISHRQQEQRAQILCAAQFDIFVCLASGKSHCPNAYIHTTLRSTAWLLFRLLLLLLPYTNTHAHTRTQFKWSHFGYICILTHAHTIYTLFVVQPSMKRTHTFPEKNTVWEWSLPEKSWRICYSQVLFILLYSFHLLLLLFHHSPLLRFILLLSSFLHSFSISLNCLCR